MRRTLLVVCTLMLAAAPYGGQNLHAEAPGKTEQVSVFGLGQMTVPADFPRARKQSGILAHEFQATVGEGKEAATARVTMMGASGDVAQNITRWKGQFKGNDDAFKSEEMKVGDWKVHLVDVAGTYAETMGGGPFSGGKRVNRKDYAMTGAILIEPGEEDGASQRKYFVKLIGPAKVVKANREAFVKMIKSIEK